MKLSNLLLNQIELIKDGSFDAMALCDAQTGMDTFIYIEHEKYIERISKNPDITCVICTEQLVKKMPDTVKGLCISESPKEDFFRLHIQLCRTKEYVRQVFKTKIGKNNQISPLAFVEEKNVITGDNVKIEEFASIKANTVIGDNVTIRAGAIIGGDSLEYKGIGDKLFFVNHVGGVIIGDNVDICSNTSISKAVFPWDNTFIGDYTKIGNNNHISHCCKIGKRNIIVDNVTFCGSAVSEDDVYIGPNATIGKIKLGEKSRVLLGAVVIEDVEPEATVSGNFAIEHIRQLMHTAKLKNTK